VRSIDRGDRPPRRLRRWRLPWRRPSRHVHPPRSEDDRGRIIQFPGRFTPAPPEPPPRATPPKPPAGWGPEQPSIRVLFLAVLVGALLIAGSTAGYYLVVQHAPHHLRLQPATVHFEVLTPRGAGAGNGTVAFRTNRVEGLLGFRYTGCPSTPHGAFRLSLAPAGGGNQQTLVDYRTADTRTFRIDAAVSYVLRVVIPAPHGCRRWTIASNADGSP